MVVLASAKIFGFIYKLYFTEMVKTFDLLVVQIRCTVNIYTFSSHALDSFRCLKTSLKKCSQTAVC